MPAGAVTGAGASAAGACAGAASGATGPLESKRLWLLELPINVRMREVAIKSVARMAVVRVMKLAPPDVPNTVWLEPPKLALISAPLPDCKRIEATRRTMVSTWRMVIAVCIAGI